ncbi:MAG: inositol monophosphatase [Clostridia bacterium]|nr:inositol monophosphatase [Clostridia bacterium]
MTLFEKARLAEETARAAGAMLEHHGAFQVRLKSENDFVTEMDIKSEALIRERLLTACSEDLFYGEESGGTLDAPGVWIVDPIDGTANFMRGERAYAISIAYAQNGVLSVGCVYHPPTNEMFTAVRGGGAFLNGEPIHVSNIDVLRRAIVHIGFGHRNPEYLAETEPILFPLLRSVSDLRRSGTAAYDICCVAAGRAEAFVEQGLSIYDYAAGYVVLTEAGGKMEGWHPWQNPIETGCLLAGNGILNSAISAILNAPSNL